MSKVLDENNETAGTTDEDWMFEDLLMDYAALKIAYEDLKQRFSSLQREYDALYLSFERESMDLELFWRDED